MPQIDPAFTDLAPERLADAALGNARLRGAEHADFRLERIRVGTLRLRDGQLDTSADTEDLGIAVRVVHDGAWGFASGVDRTPEAAATLAEQAIAAARVSRVLSSDPVVLADEPVYAKASWISAYDVDPFDVAEDERIGRLAELSDRLLSADGVDHVDAHLMHVRENKFYADAAGTSTMQQRVRLQAQFTAVHVDQAAGTFFSMRTLAPPVGRGWEFLTGTGWDFDREIDELPGLLAEHVKAPSVEAGRYDLVIDPSNLWLTIHESIGHATELDRALGYEAAYAGTSFATPDQLGSLRYGSPIMNVTGDRVVEHGLATIGYDDEGVATQQFDIVRDGVLVGYQLNRQMARANGMGRSNGCAFADSPGHIPLQRMANVSLQPAPDGPTTADLISRRRAGHLHPGRPVVVDRHAAVQLPIHRAAVLPHRERPTGRTATRCCVPSDDDELLGIHGSGRRPRNLRPRRGIQLWQGTAGPGRRRLARLSERAIPWRQRPFHSGGRWPMIPMQDLVERVLSHSTADGCVVVGSEHTETNLRWAANNLTTNGQMASRSVTVISILDEAAGPSAGVVTRSVTSADEVIDLVAASEQAARRAGPADDAAPLVEPYDTDDDWSADPARTSVAVFERFADGARRRLRGGSRRDRLLFGFAEHAADLHVRGILDWPTSAIRSAHRTGRAQRQVRRLPPLRVGRRAYPRFHRRGHRSVDGPAEHPAGLGRHYP